MVGITDIIDPYLLSFAVPFKLYPGIKKDIAISYLKKVFGKK